MNQESQVLNVSTPPATAHSFKTAQKVAIIGGGIVGVTSAHALLQAGFEVHVFEKGSTVALNSSFAGGGVAAVGSVQAVSSSDALARFVRQSLSRHAALRWDVQPSLSQWSFVARLMRHSTQAKTQQNQAALLRLAHYSQSLKNHLDTQIPFDHEQTQGSLQLFRTAKELDRAVQKLNRLDGLSVPHTVLDADACRVQEAGLNPQTLLAGGIAYATDSAGNTALYTKQLKQITHAAGAQYHFEVAVSQLVPEAQGWRVMTQSLQPGVASHSAYFDAVVVATGSDSLPLLHAQGIKLPLYPLRGYALTLPISSLEDAPNATVLDDGLQVSMTRLGLRLRVAGQAEIGSAALCEAKGKNAGKLAVRDAPVKTLSHVLQTWFPYAGKLSEASYWCGTYPTLPDGPPVVGATPVPGLFVNMGHGNNGWGNCFGAAQLLADAMSGKPAEIETTGLTLARYLKR